MTIRSDVIASLYDRINDALSAATVEVGEVVSDIARPGSSLVVIQPGSDDPWDDGNLRPEFREFLITVQMARSRQGSESSLQAWSALEALLESVIEAVETDSDQIVGLSSIVRQGVEPSEQPVGGIAAGLEVTWAIRYVPE